MKISRKTQRVDTVQDTIFKDLSPNWRKIAFELPVFFYA